MRSGRHLERFLSKIATRSIASNLMRFVPLESLLRVSPLDYLYASGRPNRCNPGGVKCIYFSEDEQTAGEELRRGYSDLLDREQPRVAFTGRANLAKVIDLGDSKVAKGLGITEDDLYGDWQFASSPTPLQQVGRWIARQTLIAGLRFPSAAAHEAGFEGWNLALFDKALKAPDSLEILGPKGNVLARLPKPISPRRKPK